MRILVATKLSQGVRKNDFNFCDDNEILMFGSECDGERIDGSCGCKRSLCGVHSSKATTTFRVVEMDVDLVGIIKKSLIDNKWAKLVSEEELNEWATRDALELMRVAEFFDSGDILEKRGKSFAQRGRVKAKKGA